MKLSTKSLALTGVLLLVGVQTAFAGDWSVGVFAGQTKADGLDQVCSDVEFRVNLGSIFDPNRERISCSEDDSDSALGLNIAYNFNDTWGLELGYVDLGEYALTLSSSIDSTEFGVDAKAPYFAGVGTLSLSDNFSVSARTGVFKASGDITTTGSIGSSVNVDGDAQFYAGVSLDYSLSDTISAQLRYDNFDEFDVAGLGLKFHF